MFNNFEEEARRIIVSAKLEMKRLKHPYVGSEHLLLAILNSDKNFYLIAFLNIPQYNNEDVLKKEDGFIKLYPCSYLFITDKELTSNLINIDNKIIVQANFIVKLTKDEMIEEIIKNKKYKILIEK